MSRIAPRSAIEKNVARKLVTRNKKARTDAGLSKFWLLDLGSNQGPTD